MAPPLAASFPVAFFDLATSASSSAGFARIFSSSSDLPWERPPCTSALRFVGRQVRLVAGPLLDNPLLLDRVHGGDRVHLLIAVEGLDVPMLKRDVSDGAVDMKASKESLHL